MAIIQPGNKRTPNTSGDSVIPSGKGVVKKIPAPKGVIIEGRKTEKIEKTEPNEDHSTLNVIFPTKFTLLTIIVVMFCLSIIAVLMDVSDSLRAQAIQVQLLMAKNSIRKFFITDIVQDKVAFESRVSLVSVQSKRSFRVRRQEPTGSVTLQTVRYKSPQMLTMQVLRIINDSNKRQMQARRLAMAIVAESVHQSYDPLFVAAVIKSESAFNEMAVSNKGAQGLMQIMPDTGRYLAKANNVHWPVPVKLTDAGYNIHLGVKYLKELEGMFGGNRLLTLIAYNWGPGKLDQAIRSKHGVPAECMRYALKILRDHKLWEETPSV